MNNVVMLQLANKRRITWYLFSMCNKLAHGEVFFSFITTQGLNLITRDKLLLAVYCVGQKRNKLNNLKFGTGG